MSFRGSTTSKPVASLLDQKHFRSGLDIHEPDAAFHHWILQVVPFQPLQAASPQETYCRPTNCLGIGMIYAAYHTLLRV